MSTLRASNARSASVVHGIVIEARLCKRLQQTKRKDIKIDEAVEQENLNSSSGNLIRIFSMNYGNNLICDSRRPRSFVGANRSIGESKYLHLYYEFYIVSKVNSCSILYHVGKQGNIIFI